MYVDNFESWIFGHEARGKFWQPRNLQFHKKYFALLNVGFTYQNIYDNFEHFRKVVLYEIGHCDFYATTDGTVITEVKSISFAKCDELEFRDIYSKTIDLFIKKYAKGKTQEEIDSAVNSYLTFA